MLRSKKVVSVITVLIVGFLVLSGCSGTPTSEPERAEERIVVKTASEDYMADFDNLTQYIKLIANQQFDEAKKLSCKEWEGETRLPPDRFTSLIDSKASKEEQIYEKFNILSSGGSWDGNFELKWEPPLESDTILFIKGTAENGINFYMPIQLQGCAGDVNFEADDETWEQVFDREYNLRKVAGVTNVAFAFVGPAHDCAILVDTTVQCWGDNTYGVFGDGSTTDSKTPVTVPELNGVTQLALGAGHTCALMENKTVKCWGLNKIGSLGNGTYEDSFTPVDVTGLTGVTKIVARGGYTCALLGNKTAQCWGETRFAGQDTPDKNTPVPVPLENFTDIEDIVVAGPYTCVVRTGGTITCWGNRYGGPSLTKQDVHIGDPSEAKQVVTNSDTICRLTEAGEVFCKRSLQGNPFTAPWENMNLNNITEIDAGVFHICGLSSDGGVSCWGENLWGQTGSKQGNFRPDETPKITKVKDVASAETLASGGRSNCIIKNGELFCWGLSADRQKEF